MTPEIRRATSHLRRVDATLAKIIAQYGPCTLQPALAGQAAGGRHYFRALVEAILAQQLSIKAAATIFKRFRDMLGNKLQPASILQLSDAQFRSVGISRQKTVYLRDLAQKWNDGNINHRHFAKMHDEEIIAALTQVKGIGRWTAEMFLIFSLGRLDVLPVGDLGFRKAVKRAYRLRRDPSPKRMAELGDIWRPYRSIATWYLWASLDNKPM